MTKTSGIVLAVLAFALVAGQAVAADDEAIQKGKQVYDYWCVTCHGPQLSGTVALQTKYNGSKPALLEERTDLSPLVTKTMVRRGVSIMPFFRKTEVSDADLETLVAYLARNNASGTKSR